MSRRPFRHLNGILLLDKAVGVSSNKALQQVRFLFQAEKAGHTGSLDPLASGLLPVCFGEATRLSAFLLDADKRYSTTATLGWTSTTGDAEGEKCQPRPIPSLTPDLLESVLVRFRGTLSQVPPMYSALKQAGQPLYKLARQGVAVERQARTVTIHQLELLSHTPDTLTLAVACSKGTYIRTLVEDMGEALGCGAYVSWLRREAVGPFNGLTMHTLPALQALAEQGGLEALETCLLPPDAALPHVPCQTVPDTVLARLRQGQRIRLPDAEDATLLRLYDETGRFAGLGTVSSGILSGKRLFSS